MALRGREMSALIREEHIALEAWKPAKNADSHIPTAAASTASKGIKSQIPRQMRGFTLSCAEPNKLSPAGKYTCVKISFISRKDRLHCASGCMNAR